MRIKLHSGDLNRVPCPPHSINIYTCKVTTAPKMCNGKMAIDLLWDGCVYIA